MLLLLIVRSPVALVLVALVSTSVAFDFIGSVADKRIPGIAIGIAGKCAADGRAVDCDTAGSGVSTVGRSVGRCASASVLGVCDEVPSSLGFLRAVP